MSTNEKEENVHATKAGELEQKVHVGCNAQMPTDELAAMLQCSEELLEQSFGDKLEQWRKEGRAIVRQKLYEEARNGKAPAMNLFLKSYCGPGNRAQKGEAEDPIANYNANLRAMSDTELREEIERQEIASGSHTQEKTPAGKSRRESAPS